MPFPFPLYSGKQQLWHLAAALEWFRRYTSMEFDTVLDEVAECTLTINTTLLVERRRLDPELGAEIRRLMAS